MTIRKRFLFSVGANIARAAVSLVVGLLVARGLGPEDYGNLAYLLGSFWAIRALFDMGTSSAFYTFIAQKQRGKIYYLAYFAWLALQLGISISLVTFLLPQVAIDRFWLGQERPLILVALFANFLQNQVWQTVVQMHEAARKTVRVQIAGLLIIVAHLIVVALLYYGKWLSVATVLWALVAEYILAAAWLSGTYRSTFTPEEAAQCESNTLRQVLREYGHYCRPMIVIALFTFCYEMADRWLLQRFAGASQQGFYQVATQLSTISLLAATSILNILWKEIAEACGKGDSARIIFLYQRATRALVLLAATVSCFLAPWANELLGLLLGRAYGNAGPVLFVMLFYPVHQAMGQVNGTLFMATGQTNAYMRIAVAGLLVSMPVSYLLLAPAQGYLIPGMAMGAMGLAIKIVMLNILFANIQSWLLARHYQTSFQWRFQVTGILSLTAVGFAARYFISLMAPDIPDKIVHGERAIACLWIACGGVVYLIGVVGIFLRAPRTLGMDVHDVETVRNWFVGRAWKSK